MNDGYWIRCGPIFYKVKGRPVHVCDGIEAFAHRPVIEPQKGKYEVNELSWEISDARTGLAFGVRSSEPAKTVQGAVELAKEKVKQAATLYGGLEGWLKALEGFAVTPRYYEEYYDAQTAPVPLEGAEIV